MVMNKTIFVFLSQLSKATPKRLWQRQQLSSKRIFQPRSITRSTGTVISSAYFEGQGENPQLIVGGGNINIHFCCNQIKYLINAQYINPYLKSSFQSFGENSADEGGNSKDYSIT